MAKCKFFHWCYMLVHQFTRAKYSMFSLYIAYVFEGISVSSHDGMYDAPSAVAQELVYLRQHINCCSLYLGANTENV